MTRPVAVKRPRRVRPWSYDLHGTILGDALSAPAAKEPLHTGEDRTLKVKGQSPFVCISYHPIDEHPAPQVHRASPGVGSDAACKVVPAIIIKDQNRSTNGLSVSISRYITRACIVPYDGAPPSLQDLLVRTNGIFLGLKRVTYQAVTIPK